jgi:photosystem II stability/assembly factor-like uncharacterized protein
MKTQTLILLLIFSIMASCKKEKAEPDPDNSSEDVIIAEEARVLDTESRAEIESLDTISYTFVFKEGGSFASELKANDILVDDVSSLAPYGFLRKVSSVENKDGNIVVLTSQASLEDIIEKGSVELHSVSLKAADIDEIYLAEGISFSDNLKSTNLLGFDMDFEHHIGGNQNASLTGSMYFSLDFNFELDINLGGVDYFKTSVEVDELASLGLEVSADVNLDEEITFAQITFTPWTVMIGIVPLVFVPKVELVLHSDLTITGTVQSYATQNYSREIGLEYDGDDWTKINSTDPAPGFTIQPAALTDKVDYNVKVGPKASLKLYGIAGPYIDLLLVSDLEAEKSPNGFNLDYDLNLESNAGVEIDLLFYELEKDFQLFDVNLDHQELNDEPLYQSFSIQSPADGAKVNISEVLNIQTYLTGLPPSEVRFYVDDLLINTDTEEPFEYAWTVEGTQGLHTIKAIADYGNTTLTSEVLVTFQSGGWQQIDVSALFGTDYELEIVRFSDTENGWIMGRTIYAIPTQRFCLRTNDGGKTWSKVYSGDAGAGSPASDLILLGESVAYFTAGLWVFETTNGGVDWDYAEVPSGYPDIVRAEYIEVNENGDLYALGYSEMFTYQSGGSGEWTLIAEYYEQDDFEIVDIVGMSFPVDNTGYFFGTTYHETLETYSYKTDLYKTIDGGVHWTALNIEFDKTGMDDWSYRDVFFIDNNTGWIIGPNGNDVDRGFILKTTDGGVTWSTQFTNYLPYNIYFLEKSNGYISYIGFPDVHLGYTDDGGDNWYAFQTPFEDHSFATEIGNIFFVDAEHGWYTHDEILLRYALEGE